MFCTNCGTKNDDGVKFCTNCGADLQATEANAQKVEATEAAPEVEAVQAAVATQEVAESVEDFTETEAAIGKPFIKKIIAAVIAVIVLAAVVVAGFKIVGMFSDEVDHSKDPLLYVKDGEVNVLPEGKKESYEIADIDDDTLVAYTFDVTLTDDGKGLFFPDDLSENEFDLYYRKVNDVKGKDGKGQKVAKDVTSYEVVPGKKDIVYTSDDKLYYCNLKDDRVIDKDVTYFYITEDGKKVCYWDDDENFYICGLGKNDKPEKIDSDIELVSSPYTDYEKFYYIKDEKLYEKELGKSKKKLASDVCDAFVLDGKVFVEKVETKELKFKDLMIDDLDSEDAPIDPDTIESPNYDDYDDYDAYWDAYDAYWEEYEEAYEKWNMYENVEEIKEYFDENPIEKTTFSIYELKGEKLNLIDEGIAEFESNYDQIRTYYKASKEKDFKKIKLSEVTGQYDAENKIYEAMYEKDPEYTLCVLTASGKSFVGFEVEGRISDMHITEDGKTMYVLDKKEGKEEGELVQYKIGSSKLSGKKVISEDVSSFDVCDDNAFIVYDKDDEATFIKNSKKTSLGENIYSYNYIDGVLYYLSDYDDYSGELCVCESGKTKTIVDDVAQFNVFSSKRIAYISDYDTEDRYGELYICNKKGKGKLVDEEVSAILAWN